MVWWWIFVFITVWLSFQYYCHFSTFYSRVVPQIRPKGRANVVNGGANSRSSETGVPNSFLLTLSAKVDSKRVRSPWLSVSSQGSSKPFPSRKRTNLAKVPCCFTWYLRVTPLDCALITLATLTLNWSLFPGLQCSMRLGPGLGKGEWLQISTC